MMARLSHLSEEASPSPFHTLLKELDRRGKLQRVYTQNIDALEQKAGMTFGVPERTKQNRLKGAGKPLKDTTAEVANGGEYVSSGTSETPRCIPLHGTLETMHCVSCAHTVPLSDYLATLSDGALPECPECASMQEARSANGMRLRTVGKLRPSVVLYNEDHRDAEDVGSVVERDLPGRRSAGPDLLLVVGTSLRVPGTKRIVREFSKAVRTREEARLERIRSSTQRKANAAVASAGVSDECEQAPMPSPTPSPRRSPAPGEAQGTAITSVYLNLDFPVPSREWDGVFDAWVQGDAQVFAYILQEEMRRLDRQGEEKADREQRAREDRLERKRQKQIARELKEARMAMTAIVTEQATPELKVRKKAKTATPGKKRAGQKSVVTAASPAKRRRVTLHVKKPSSSSIHHSRLVSQPAYDSNGDSGSDADSRVLPLVTVPHPSTPRESCTSRGRSMAHRPSSHRQYWTTILDNFTSPEEPLPYRPHASSSSSSSMPESEVEAAGREESSEDSSNDSGWSFECNISSHEHAREQQTSYIRGSSTSLLTPLPSPTSSSFDLPDGPSGPAGVGSGSWEPPTPPSAPKRKGARRSGRELEVVLESRTSVGAG